MPKIIDYSTPQRGLSLPNAQPDRITTGQEGRGLQELGRAISDVGLGVTDAIHKRQIQKDSTQAYLDLAKTDSEFQERITQEIKDVFQWLNTLLLK